MQQRTIFIIGGIIIAAIAVAGLAYQNLALFGVRRERVSTGQDSVSPRESGEKPYIVEVIPSEKLSPYRGVPVGTINESEESKKTTSPSVREKLLQKLTTIAASLATNSDDLDSWIEIGSIKHVFGDEIGARDAWEYASVIRPTNTTSFFNLGNLYGYYLKDKAKAEKNYRMVLQNDPNYIPGYLTLVAFYRDVYTEKYPAEAEKVLLAGEKVLPLDLNIIQSLAFLYKDTGNSAKAIEYFEKYLVIDPKNDAMRAEFEALRAR